ncbi:MAG: family 10 glycosylhydrolase [Rubrivivax sp.]
MTLLTALGSCSLWPPIGPPPPLPREFRAAWVASVAHIDWPSRAGLTSAEQRAEMLALLDRAVAIGLNALVLQVRPAADALYRSALEPWSEYVTGASGRAPDEDWDPLAEWVDGAHRRGLELHAWFNPYRARHPSARSEPAATHIARTDPAIVKAYGDYLWLDPGEPRAAERMRAVVLDVVQRYDIDGVHLDDYFYPYPVTDAQGAEVDFPDGPSWQRYGDGGGALARADWRRDNVDRLIETLYREVHAAKPWLRFGISPFGLPRPDRRPPGIRGFSQYDKLYADVERWWEQGWMDYLAPQLYWPIGKVEQAFAPLQEAWRAGNAQGRHLWPGLFTSRLGAERDAYEADEVLAQVALTRGPRADNGHLHFSMAALLQDRDGIAARLRAGPYSEPALTPATPWLAEPAPQPPLIEALPQSDGSRALWPRQGVGPPLRQAVLWQWRRGAWQWQAQALPAAAPLVLAADAQAAWVLSIGRSGLESAAVAII